jgi:predicted dehydrogenase
MPESLLLPAARASGRRRSSCAVIKQAGAPQPAEPAQARAATIGVAVVGCGYWGPNLVRSFFDAPGARLVALCDQQPQRMTPLLQRHPSVEGIESFDTLLADPRIDAVVIATPASTHADLAKRALLAGKHVLVEKPMALSSVDAEEMVEIAARMQRVLMVDHTFAYTGAVRRIKQLLDDRDLGDLYYYDSVRVNLGRVQHDISVIWDLAAHDFSIMDYLLGRLPRTISTMAAAHVYPGRSDIAYITAQFDNELIAHFHVNWLSPVKVRQTMVGGNRRMVVYDDIEPAEEVKIYDRGVSCNLAADAPPQDRVAYRLGDVYAPTLDGAEALVTECRHFIDCIRTGRTPITDGQAGLRVVRMLEAAERSAQNGGRLEELG